MKRIVWQQLRDDSAKPPIQVGDCVTVTKQGIPWDRVKVVAVDGDTVTVTWDEIGKAKSPSEMPPFLVTRKTIPVDAVIEHWIATPEKPQ